MIENGKHIHKSLDKFLLIWKGESDRGMTLVEVLASISIFTLVLGSLFSLYFYALHSYQTSSVRLDLQQNVRLAGDFLTRELRHAVELQLTDKGELSYRLPDDAFCYRIRQKNEEIVLLINNTETKIAYNIKILGLTWDDNKKTLHYKIGGDADGQSYSLRSAVFMPNIEKGW